jgi:hypothetical protein
LLRRLVHPDGHHGQALEVLLLALGCHAVIVFLRPFGMQLAPARNTMGHYSLSFKRMHNAVLRTPCRVRLFQD